MIKGFILTVQCFTVRYTFACSVDIRLYKIERERERERFIGFIGCELNKWAGLW